MIPYFNMILHNVTMLEELSQVFTRVLSSGQMILGPETKAFEQEFASFIDVPYCSTVSTGVAAITLGLKAAGIKPGDIIAAPAFTAYPTICGIVESGAIPLAVDIQEDDFTMDPRHLEQLFRDGHKIQGVLVVHLYGHCCDLARIIKICSDYGADLYEDCAQAHGTEYYGKPAGSFGKFSAFSFYPTKNLGAPGEGGAVTTNNPDIYHTVNMLRNYGQSEKYHHDICGANYRFDELKAAILRVKLTHLQHWNHRRAEIAGIYNNKLSGIKDLILPQTKDYCTHAHHIYAVRTTKRDNLREHLKNAGIGTEIHYPHAVIDQPAFPQTASLKTLCPHAQKAASEVLSLPLYPELSTAQTDEIYSQILEFYR